jgi:topoisomerase-4 subunit A
VKRFMIETTTLDKEFNFISESIGSRLVVATTAESAEIDVEFISGKNKEKKTDTMNLDELIDVKGWKAVGNRLSLDRVTKVTLISDQEEAGSDSAADDDDGGAGSEGDQAKKKEQPDSNEPTDLFQSRPSHLSEEQQRILRGQPQNKQQSSQPESQQASHEANQQTRQQASQPESHQQKPQSQRHQPSQQTENQQDLFGSPREKSSEEKKVEEKRKDDRSFGVGETIEFDV